MDEIQLREIASNCNTRDGEMIVMCLFKLFERLELVIREEAEKTRNKIPLEPFEVTEPRDICG